MKRRSVLAALAASALVFGACGGDDDSDESTTTEAAATVATAESSPQGTTSAADDPEPDFRLLLEMARYPNVWVKVSELTSVSKSGTYPFADAYPYVKRIYEAFGPDRLLFGTGYPGAARAASSRARPTASWTPAGRSSAAATRTASTGRERRASWTPSSAAGAGTAR